MDLETLQYPTGRFTPKATLGPDDRREMIEKIAAVPAQLRAEVENLNDEQLDTPYRPGGWTVRQVVHHLPDSHLNAYIRFRLALTEDTPVIKPYDQVAWAELTDARSAPIGPSIDMMTGLHARWTDWLHGLSDEDWQRSFQHPEMGSVGLETNLQIYAWHGAHHLGQIQSIKKQKGW
jgi:uncharacterized damage-inducible protein DinB